MRFFLSAYTIKVYEQKNEKDKEFDNIKKYIRLDKINYEYDFFDFVKDFLENLKIHPFVNDSKQVTMKVSRLEVDQINRRLTGVMDSGIYGNSSTLIDKETYKEVFKKENQHSEVLPFFFLLFIPEGKKECILMLERISEKGIRKSFEYILNRSFKKKFSNLNIDIGQLIPSEVAKEFIDKGIIKTLRFIKYDIPHDKIDALEEGYEKINITREIIYRSKSMPIKNKILSIFNPGVNSENLFEMKDLNKEDYDLIKIEIEIGGSKKIINLSNINKVRNYLDISDVALVNGQPEFNSIEQIALDFCKKLSDLMYQELR